MKFIKVTFVALAISFIVTPVRAQSVVIGGRDLGIPVYGTSLLLFGDTPSRNAGNTGGLFNGSTATPINGDTQLWTPLVCGCASTPTGGIAVGGVYYAWNMNVTTNDGNSFTVQASGVAVSHDRGAHWVNVLLWGQSTIISQMTPYGAVSGGYVYLLGTIGGRLGNAYLVRVKSTQLTNVSAYRFYANGTWTDNLNAATPVITDTVGELSVSWNTYLDKYLILYASPAHNGIVYRTAKALSGPWSDTVMLIGGCCRYYAPEQLSATTGRGVRYLVSDWDSYSVELNSLTLP